MANKTPQIHALGAGDYGSKNKGTLGDVVSQIPAVLDTIGALFTKVLPGIITYGANEVADLFRPENKQYNGTLNDWMTKDGWVATLQNKIGSSDKSMVISQNDPYEINSVLDAVAPGYNSAIAKKYGDDNAINRTKEYFSGAYNFYIRPLLLGNFSVAGINALTSIGEGLDAVSNVVKAALAYEGSPLYQDSYFESYDVALSYVDQVSQGLCEVVYNADGDVQKYGVLHPKTGALTYITPADFENYTAIVNSGRTANIADMNTLDRVKSAIGLGNNGRVNYTVNTGNLGTDILGEILVDPTTYLSLGAGGAVKLLKSANKAATKEVLGTLSKKSPAVAKAVLKIGEDNLVRDVIDAANERVIRVAKNSDAIPMMQHFLKEASSDLTEHSFKVRNAGEAMRAVLFKNGIVADVTDETVIDTINKALSKHKNEMHYTVMHATQSLDKGINKAMWWAGGLQSGLAPIARLLKGVRKTTAKALSNKLEDVIKPYTDDNGTPSVMKFDDMARAYKQTIDNSKLGMSAAEQAAVKEELSADVLAPQSTYVVSQIQNTLANIKGHEAAALERINKILNEAYATTNFDKIIAQYESVLRTHADAAYLSNTINVLKQTKSIYQSLQQQASRATATSQFTKIIGVLGIDSASRQIDSYVERLQDIVDDFIVDLDVPINRATAEHFVPMIEALHKQRALFKEEMLAAGAVIPDIGTAKNAINALLPEQKDLLNTALGFYCNAHNIDTMDSILDSIIRSFESKIKTGTMLAKDYNLDAFVDEVLNSDMYAGFFTSETNYFTSITPEYLKRWRNVLKKTAPANISARIPKTAADIEKQVAKSAKAAEKLLATADKVRKDISLPKVKYAGETRIRPDFNDVVLKDYFLGGNNITDPDEIIKYVTDVLENDRKFISDIFAMDSNGNEFGIELVDELTFHDPDFGKKLISTWADSNPIIEVLLGNAHAVSEAQIITHNETLNTLTRTLEKYKQRVIEKAGPEDTTVSAINEAIARLQYYELPAVQSDELVLFTDLIRVKLSQVTATEMLLAPDSGLQEYIAALSTREFTELGEALHSAYQEGLLAVSETAWDAIDAGLRAAEEVKTQVPAFQLLMQTIKDKLNLNEEQYIALYNAITKHRYTYPASLFERDTLDEIVQDAVNYNKYVEHPNKRLSLEAIGAEHKSELDALRKLNGFAPLKADEYESHIAIEDSINNYILHKELIDTSPEYAAAVKDKRVFFIDIEAQNIETTVYKNQIHSIAIVEYDDTGKIVNRYSIGRNSDDIVCNIDMLMKLYPDAKDTATRIALYKDAVRKQSADGVFANNKDLAEAARAYLEQAVKTQLETIGKNNVCVVGHNISAYDAVLLNDAVHQLNTPNKLFGLDTVDTLIYSDKKYHTDTIQFTTVQQEQLAEALRVYATYLQNAGVDEIATIISRDQMSCIDEMCNAIIHDQGNVFSPEQVAIAQQIKKAPINLRATMRDISLMNEGLGDTLMPRDVFVTSPTLRNAPVIAKQWHDYFINLGYTEEQIAKRFGDTQMALTTSAILGAADDTARLAVKRALTPDTIRQWFEVDKLLVDGCIPSKQANLMQKTSEILHRYDELFGKRVNNPAYKFFENRAVYMEEIEALYNSYKNIGVFKELDNMVAFDQLTDTQKMSIVAYMIKVAPEKTKGLSSLIDIAPLQNMSEVREEVVRLLKGSKNKYNPYDPKLYNEMLSEIEIYNRYKELYTDFCDLKMTLDQLTNVKDHNGIIGATLTVRMRALQPLFDFVQSIGTLTPRQRKDFITIDVDAAMRRTRGIIADVIHTPPEAMKARLLGSHGVISIDASGFAEQRIKTVMRKYDTDKLKAEGVYAYFDEPSKIIWFTLDKTANVSARISGDLSKVDILVNGSVYDPYRFGTTPAAKCYGAIKTDNKYKLIDIDKFTAAEETLIKVTDGAIAGSDYTLMTVNRLEDIYNNKMPSQVAAHYDYETFKQRAFFKNVTYNRSILKANAKPLTIRMYEAALHAMDMARSDTLYKQCMMSDFSAIKADTPLGQAILQDPKKVAKTFRQYGSYIGASLGVRGDEAVIVKTYDLGNASELEALVREGGQIFDYTEYAQIYDVINNHYWSNAKLEGWRKLVSVYKIGALVNPGTWARNMVDSVVKNIMATGKLDMLKYHARAAKNLHAFNQHAKHIAEARANGIITDELSLRKYFKNSKDLTYEEYTELKQLMGIEVFGGEASTFTKLEREHQAEMLKTWYDDGNIDVRTYAKYTTEAKLRSTTSAALAPMSWTENVARYALYYALRDEGFGINQIAKRVADTHFDYSNKSAFEHTVEMLIPFYTFQRRNLNYWLDAVDRNPEYITLLSNIVDPLIDIDQYTPEEIENSNLIQHHILAGNIKINDNIYISTGFSFMDAYTRITDALGSTKDSVFNPLQIILDLALQGAADHAYHSGDEMISTWLQNTFGLQMTDEQIRAKYGEWTDNFYKLTGYQASLGATWEGLKYKLTKNKQWLMLIPAVGTQISRTIKTHAYWDDKDILGSVAYGLGLVNHIPDYAKTSGLQYAAKRAQYRSWLRVLGYTDDLNGLDLSELKALYEKVTENYKEAHDMGADENVSAIYVLLQDEQKRYLYANLKSSMGYPDTKYSELPQDVKNALYWALTEQVDLSPSIDILTNAKVMGPVWNRLANKYGVSTEELIETAHSPAAIQLYSEAAETVVTIANINMMLTVPQYREAYDKARSMLGLADIDAENLPLDVLRLVEAYMVTNAAKPVKSNNYIRRYNAGKKVYHTMSYSPLGTPAYEMRNLNMHGTPQRNSYAANKYGVRSHQAGYRNIYQKLYTKTGKSRMELRMLPITPGNLKYRIKDYFHYF